MPKTVDWYKTGLVAAIVIASLLAVLQVLVYLFGRPGAVSELDALATAVGKALILVIAASLMLRVGNLLKIKFAGTEMEFEKLVTETSNANARELSSIKTELAALRATEDNVRPDRLTAPDTKAAAGMPALKPVTLADDPNKGRFGGESARDGYVLGAVFLSKADDKIVKLELSVHRPDDPHAVFVADFFLHGPTFGEAPVRNGALQGVAKMSLIVWGGFTAGVWIVGTQTLLELDLAQIAGAPKVIREL